MTEEYDTKKPPDDCFREIGFDVSIWPDRCEETIFFLLPSMSDDPGGRQRRLEKVSKEAVEEFVRYWENQISVAKDYVKNGCNPNIHEWKKEA